MSFLFGRARTRANTLDLSKQAKEHVLKLDVAGKVGAPSPPPRSPCRYCCNTTLTVGRQRSWPRCSAR